MRSRRSPWTPPTPRARACLHGLELRGLARSGRDRLRTDARNRASRKEHPAIVLKLPSRPIRVYGHAADDRWEARDPDVPCAPLGTGLRAPGRLEGREAVAAELHSFEGSGSFQGASLNRTSPPPAAAEMRAARLTVPPNQSPSRSIAGPVCMPTRTTGNRGLAPNSSTIRSANTTASSGSFDPNHHRVADRLDLLACMVGKEASQ